MGFDLSKLTALINADAPATPSRAGVIGIDIGSSALKIVQIKNVKGTPTLETYGELQLGPYENIDLGRSTHLPPEKTVEALIDILREAGASAKDAAFALSYNASFTTNISIPTLEQEKLGTMIPVEARKYIPVSLSKVGIEWFPIATHPESQSTQVFVSAVYNDARASYETIMRGSGLRVLASEIEIFSTMRAVLSPTDDTVAVLDFGAISTRLYIIQKGVVLKTYSTMMSGVDITSAIAAALAIEFKEAEDIKRTLGIPGKKDDPRIQKAIMAVLDRGLREIHMVMKRFEEDEHITIEKIALSGSGASLMGLGVYVQDMCSKQTVLANPFNKIAYPAFLEDTLVSAGPTFAVAVGVALRAFQST